MTNKIAQTYCWHGDKTFFVSTINRESSVLSETDFVYAETLAWELGSNGERVRLVAQEEDGRGQVSAHLSIVEALVKHGEYTS
jgi:hypothetical protein